MISLGVSQIYNLQHILYQVGMAIPMGAVGSDAQPDTKTKGGKPDISFPPFPLLIGMRCRDLS